MASSLLLPQTNFSALKSLQTFGLSGKSKISHCSWSFKWMQGTNAGFPSGIPGIGDEMEGMMQQAPQLDRHSISEKFARKSLLLKFHQILMQRLSGKLMLYKLFKRKFVFLV